MGLGAIALSATVIRVPAVATHIRQVLQSALLTPAYREALQATLSIPGSILSEAPDARWTRIVGTCCSAAGGRWEEAVPASAAVELFMLALDLLDDVEDNEETSLRNDLGSARLLNVTTGLLLLAQHTLLHGKRSAESVDVLLGLAVRACSGQDADLTPRSASQVGLDDALAISARKSASLTAAACQLGALAAGVDASVQALYAQFGAHMGMVGQLINDLAAIAPGARGKTDISLGRPTLPLIHAAATAHSSGVGADSVDGWDNLWMRGAVQLTWAMAETYRRHAVALIPRLTSVPTSRAGLERLVRVP